MKSSIVNKINYRFASLKVIVFKAMKRKRKAKFVK